MIGLGLGLGFRTINNRRREPGDDGEDEGLGDGDGEGDGESEGEGEDLGTMTQPTRVATNESTASLNSTGDEMIMHIVSTDEEFDYIQTKMKVHFWALHDAIQYENVEYDGTHERGTLNRIMYSQIRKKCTKSDENMFVIKYFFPKGNVEHSLILQCNTEQQRDNYVAFIDNKLAPPGVDKKSEKPRNYVKTFLTNQMAKFSSTKPKSTFDKSRLDSTRDNEEIFLRYKSTDSRAGIELISIPFSAGDDKITYTTSFRTKLMSHTTTQKHEIRYNTILSCDSINKHTYGGKMYYLFEIYCYPDGMEYDETLGFGCLDSGVRDKYVEFINGKIPPDDDDDYSIQPSDVWRV